MISGQWSENPALPIASIVRRVRGIFGKPPAVEQTPSARSGQILGYRALPTGQLSSTNQSTVGRKEAWGHADLSVSNLVGGSGAAIPGPQRLGTGGTQVVVWKGPRDRSHPP